MSNIIELHFDSLIENHEHKAQVAKDKKSFFLNAIESGKLTEDEARDLALNYIIR